MKKSYKSLVLLIMVVEVINKVLFEKIPFRFLFLIPRTIYKKKKKKKKI